MIHEFLLMIIFLFMVNDIEWQIMLKSWMKVNDWTNWRSIIATLAKKKQNMENMEN